MALSAVTAAVEARLAAHWSRCAVRGLNALDDETPADGGAILQVHYPISTAEQISTGTPGANVYRHEGAIRFILNVERGSGVAAGLVWIEELAALFRGKVFGGVRTFAPTAPVIDDRADDGLWFSLSFAVPFEIDILG